MNARILGRPRVPNLAGELVVTEDAHWFSLWRDLEASLLHRMSGELARGRFVQATKLGRRKERARERTRVVVRRIIAKSGGAPCGG